MTASTPTSSILLLGLGLGLAAGCAPDLPGSLSFQQDVQPILAANCVRCHGTPLIGGAPEGIRFDAFADLTIREATLLPTDPACLPSNPSPDPGCFSEVVRGASFMASSIAFRVADEDRPMPPRFPLDAWQIEVLEAWRDADAPRGEPRPGNQAATASVEAILRSPDEVHLTLRVVDADRDPVGGSLHVVLPSAELTLAALGAGTNEVTWDTTGVAPGSYPLRAKLDDGAGVRQVELGTVTVGGP